MKFIKIIHQFFLISKQSFSLSKRWVLRNQIETAIILLIILTALFLRLYRIDQYMLFLGDEGRDMLMMKRIWTEFDIPLIGPPMSVGNVYLGPWYYYLMAIPTGIFWMNPVAASVMVAFFGTASVGLIYFLARSWFSRFAAVVASLLYAFSPVTINYSKFSWNPNPLPFFALLSFYSLYKVHQTGNMKWLILTGVAVGFAINMHYLALLLIPALGLLWLYEIILHWQGKPKRTHIVFGTLGAIIAFLLLLSPLVVFDIKHNFPNYRGLVTLFTAKDSSVGGSLFENIYRVFPIYTDKLIGRYISGFDFGFNVVVSLLTIVPLLWVIIAKIKGKRLRWPYLALGCWTFICLAGLTFYKQEVYDHYLGFLNPAPFLLLAALGMLIWELKQKVFRYGGIFLYGLVLTLILVNMIQSSPLKNPPNRQLQRTQIIAREVLNNTEGRPYNFALIAKSNYDSAYQFYLEQYGIEPGQLPFEKTEQLFVVCEDEICTPINNPKYEIAAFGMAKIEWEKDFEGVKLFKLVANPEGKP